MRAGRGLRVAVCTVAAVVALSACGGDDFDAEPAADSSAGDASADEASGACEGTDITMSGPSGDVEVTSAQAISLVDGAAYTLYLADFELDPDEITFVNAPVVPEDGNLGVLAVTIFNAEDEVEPIEPDTTVEWTSDFGVLTFVFTIQEGEENNGMNQGAEGEVTITAVGDTFCGEVDYSDDEKSVSGTFEAPVKPLS